MLLKAFLSHSSLQKPLYLPRVEFGFKVSRALARSGLAFRSMAVFEPLYNMCSDRMFDVLACLRGFG
jgi:hypothetical protein